MLVFGFDRPGWINRHFGASPDGPARQRFAVVEIELHFSGGKDAAGKRISLVMRLDIGVQECNAAFAIKERPVRRVTETAGKIAIQAAGCVILPTDIMVLCS